MTGGSGGRRVLKGIVTIQAIAIAPAIKHRMLRYFSRENFVLTWRRDGIGRSLLWRRALLWRRGPIGWGCIALLKGRSIPAGNLLIRSKDLLPKCFATNNIFAKLRCTLGRSLLWRRRGWLGRRGSIVGRGRRRRSTCIAIVWYQTRRISLSGNWVLNPFFSCRLYVY